MKSEIKPHLNFVNTERGKTSEEIRFKKEFLTAYQMINDLHRHKHKMISLSWDENISHNLENLKTILGYMIIDIKKIRKSFK
jgi:hypothetical protein